VLTIKIKISDNMNKLITEKRTGASSTIKTKKKQHCKSVNLYHPESYKTLN